MKNNINQRMRDMLTLTKIHMLMWSVTIILMLEDDVAMLAFMFS